MCQTHSPQSRDRERGRIVVEALSWLGTPYHLTGRVKQGGVDCATFLYMVYLACGLVPETDEIEQYKADWFHHTTEQRYLIHVVRHASKVAEAVAYPTLNALPGNLILAKVAQGGRRAPAVWNHGGIVTKWPKVIQAAHPKVELVDATSHWMWAFQTVLVLDPFEVR